MKGTTRDPVGAGFFQRHVILHDADDVRLAAKVIYESLREAHFGLRLTVSTNRVAAILADSNSGGDVSKENKTSNLGTDPKILVTDYDWHSAFECVITELKRI